MVKYTPLPSGVSTGFALGTPSGEGVYPYIPPLVLIRIQYSAMKNGSLQQSKVQCGTLCYSVVQYSAMEFSTSQNNIVTGS